MTKQKNPATAPWREVVGTTAMIATGRKQRGEKLFGRVFLLECGHVRRATGLSAAHLKVGDTYRCKECETK